MLKTRQIVVYRGNLTGLIISSADGSAFVDNLTITHSGFTCNLSTVDGTAFITNPSVNLTQYPNGTKFTLTAGGKTLVGYKQTVGGGESLGTELLSSVVNSGTPYDTFVASGKDITSAICAAAGGANWNAGGSVVPGELYKSVTNLTLNSGTAPDYYLLNVLGWDTNYQLTEGNQTQYWTNTKTGDTTFITTVYGTDPHNIALTASFKKVLTPSATGATIVSTQGGSTYNWASNDGIDANSASFTLTAEPLYGIVDGTYLIEIYDSSGRMNRGVLKEIGAGITFQTEV